MNFSFNLAFAQDKWLSLLSLISLIFEDAGSSLELSVSEQVKIKVCIH